MKHDREGFFASDSVDLPFDVVADCALRQVHILKAGELIAVMDAEQAWRLALRIQSKTLTVRATVERSKARTE